MAKQHTYLCLWLGAQLAMSSCLEGIVFDFHLKICENTFYAGQGLRASETKIMAIKYVHIFVCMYVYTGRTADLVSIIVLPSPLCSQPF